MIRTRAIMPGWSGSDRDFPALTGRSGAQRAHPLWSQTTADPVLRVIYCGVFDRHPWATLILGHMGEFLPFMRSRLDSRYLERTSTRADLQISYPSVRGLRRQTASR